MQGFASVILAFSLTGCLAHPADVDAESQLATTWAPDPFCPYPSEEIFFYTDPDDCSKYIECYEGVKYVRDCAKGLLWSEDELACDYPKNVDCKSRPTPTPDGPASSEPGTTAVPINPTTEAPDVTTAPVTIPTTTQEPPIPTTTQEPAIPTTTKEPITTFSPEHLCDNQTDGTYLADPTDCKKFYECLSGKAIPGVCPTGTDWNEDILNCDRPENVKCNN